MVLVTVELIVSVVCAVSVLCDAGLAPSIFEGV